MLFMVLITTSSLKLVKIDAKKCEAIGETFLYHGLAAQQYRKLHEATSLFIGVTEKSL